MRRGIRCVGGVNKGERARSVRLWKEQREKIAHLLSSTTLHQFDILTKNENIGYAADQVHPGKAGRLDLYRLLTAPDRDCDEEEAMIATGLSEDQVVSMENQLESEVDLLGLTDPERFDAEDQKLEDFLAEVEIDLAAA